MLKKIMIGAAIAVALPASAAQYYIMVAATNSKWASLYDADSVIRKGDRILVWIKIMDGQKPRSKILPYSMQRLAVHCNDQTLQTLAVTTYKDGKAEQSVNHAGSPDPVIPGTFGETVLKVVCHTGFPLKVPNTAKVPNPKLDNINNVFEVIERP